MKKPSKSYLVFVGQVFAVEGADSIDGAIKKVTQGGLQIIPGPGITPTGSGSVTVLTEVEVKPPVN